MTDGRQGRRRTTGIIGTAALASLALCAHVVPSAAPPSERTVVTAVADSALNRILIRWRTEEGASRFALFDVLRREAAGEDYTLLNADPIRPLETAAAIEAVFTAPGRGDALAGIERIFGTDYAEDLLVLQSAGAPVGAAMQLNLLPEQNYGAALALGKGWMDETVVPGTGYVYEVWGLDGDGFRVERLGRSLAVAGAAEPPLPPAGVTCVPIGGQQGDGVAALRWLESPSVQPFAGYDILRSRRSGGSCQPSTTVRANAVPVVRSSAGRAAEGAALFGLRCSGCHAGRDLPPVAGSTIEDFRRRQYPLPGCAAPVPHNLPELNALAPGQIAAVYDYIQEAHFTDDGSATPADPLEPETDYCYQVAARDLLGRPGAPAPSPPGVCRVRDLRPPAVPKQLQSRRTVPAGQSHEVCRISWKRNGDDTVVYDLYRAGRVPRTICDEPAAAMASVPQPPPDGGGPTVFTDTGQTASDAGTPFFYAVRARDPAGNASGFSAWVPCTPRDLAPPPDLSVSLRCRTVCPVDSTCEQRGLDPDWLARGGDPDFIVSDADCLEIDALPPPGGEMPFRRRLYRCLSDSAADCRAGPDFTPAAAPEDDLVPMLDTKTWVMVRGHDRSGNMTGPSDLRAYVIPGSRRIPAPRIISARLVDAAANEYRIRFRAIDPKALIGFALYARRYRAGEDLSEEPRGGLVDGLPLTNILELLDDVWVIPAGAKSLDQILPAEPPPTAPYLVFDPVTGIYESRIAVVTAAGPVNRPVRFDLHGVGWSGLEGLAVPFVEGGLTLADGRLDWPRHEESHLAPGGVLATPVGAGPGAPYMRVEWFPSPACLTPQGLTVDRPFVIFRRRGSAPRWQQISPLFDCWSGAPPEPFPIYYDDRDVEEGVWYQYTVLRLADAGPGEGKGEFDVQHGPSTFTCFDTPEFPGTCDGPPPE